jgi:hypothetical protein
MQTGGKNLIVEELKKIKHLLILDLYSKGIPSGEIDKAVGMGAANIRGMFSKKNLKKVEKEE